MNKFQPDQNRSILPVFLVLFSCLILIVPAQAQILPDYGHPAPGERDLRYGDWALARLKSQKALTKAEQRLDYRQLNKDFTELQVLNNDLIRMRASDKSLDYQLIAQKSFEICEIANRLRTNLKLFEPQEIENKQIAPNPNVNLSVVLTILDTVIYQFVKNPIFKNVEVIDIKDAAQAQADLDRIILLSERARKKAGSLSKIATK